MLQITPYGQACLRWRKRLRVRKKKTIHEVTSPCQENNPAEMVTALISSNSRSTEGSYQEHHAKDGRSL